VTDIFAFEWTRTSFNSALLDPQWQPLVVYPGEFVDTARVVGEAPVVLQIDHAALMLVAYLDVFTHHYLQAKCSKRSLILKNAVKHHHA
jgi:DTW domain-containing protein YfiP